MTAVTGIKPAAGEQLDSLFDRVPGVYAFWREHLFRDDTDRIVRALWPTGTPRRGALVLELGCGPGFYARRLAARFDDLFVVGLDRSIAQLDRARRRAARDRLTNCRFDMGDVTALPYPDASADGIVAARLLGVVEQREQLVAEIARVLRPGGRCFIAEPRSALRAAVPLAAMRLAAALTPSGRTERSSQAAAERLQVLEPSQFAALVTSQPWRNISRWTDGSYQYAVFEKGGPAG